MTPTATKLRSPLKYHGGKSYSCRRIIALMPEHRTYVEPFCGGLSILLNKPHSRCEIVADLDTDLIRFWRAIRASNLFPQILARLQATTYSDETFEAAAAEILEGGVDHAVRYLIRNRMSRGGTGKSFAWSDRLRGGQPGDLNAWETAIGLLPEVHDRLRATWFWNCPAVETMDAWDSAESLHYLDPPYMAETRTAKAVYGHEMSVADHAALLDMAKSVKGKVMISGYACPLYELELADWNRVDWDMPNHAGQGKSKQRRTESLWMNF